MSQKYTVELTDQQWDLVALSLGYVMERAFDPRQPHNFQPVDVFARRIVRRRLNEVLGEIQSTVPDAGSEKLDTE